MSKTLIAWRLPDFLLIEIHLRLNEERARRPTELLLRVSQRFFYNGVIGPLLQRPAHSGRVSPRRGRQGMPPREPRNPLYFLLLLASLLFVITTLAYAVVPVLEEKARDAGQTPPPSPWRDTLRQDGWQWLLVEVAAMVVLGLLSMGLDRLRRLQKERAAATMPPPSDPSP